MPKFYNTIEVAGIAGEKSFADAKITGARREAYNQAADSFGFDFTSKDALTSAETIPYGAEIKVRIGRKKNGNSYSGGKIHFVGYRVQSLRRASFQMEQRQYKFAGPWEFFFERLTFQQVWKNWDNALQALVDDYRSQVVLGQSVEGGRLTIAAQITEIVNYVIAQTTAEYGSPKLQLGDVFPAFYVPLNAVNDTTCAECARLMMRWLSPTSAWFDYTTTPPTFHCKTRDKLEAVTLPCGKPATEIGITRRDDLIPPAIHLKYRRQVGGYTQLFDDIACSAGATTPEGVTDPALLPFGRKIGVQVATFDFEGPSFSNSEKGKFETDQFQPMSLLWWQKKIPALRNISVVDGPNNVQFKNPDSGVTISNPGLQYEITNGTPASWMFPDDQGIDTHVVHLEVIADFKVLPRHNVVSGAVSQVGTIQHFVKVRVTSLSGNTFTKSNSGTPAEAIPFGLAKQILDLEKIPQYQGPYTLTEEEITDVAGVGNVLNLSGGLEEWKTMNALIQQASYDYDMGTTELTFGPAEHLGAGDLIERLRVNRGPRTVFSIGANRDNTQNNNSIELGSVVPKETTSTGPASWNLLRLVSDPAVSNSGLTIDARQVDNPAAHPDPDGYLPTEQIQFKGKVIGSGSFTMKIADLLGKDVKFIELNTCEDGDSTWKRVFLCSERYH